jgi:TRAP-type transport system large permease protein
LQHLYEVFVTAAKTTAIVMFLVTTAMVSAWMITVADLPGMVSGLLQPVMDSPTLLVLAIMVLVLVVGTVMNMTSIILILAPMLMPVIKEAGIDPVYFGVLFIMSNAIGLITPPVGTVLSVVANVSRISTEDMNKGVWPFMAAQFLVLLLLVLFPSLVTVPATFFRGF